MSSNKIKYDKHISKNGLKILNFYDPDTKKVGIEFLTKASTSINPKGKEGLAHFVEHLVIKQSKKYPTPIKLGTVMENIGASKGAATSHYNTNYYIQGGAEDFDQLLDINSNMILEPHITQKSLDAERLVVEKEIVRTGAMNARLARDTIWKILYPNTPFEYANLGTKKTISKLTISDAKEFIDNNYLSNNSLVAVWGGVPSERVFKAVEKSYQKLPTKKWIEPEFKFERKNPLIITTKKSDQVSIELAFRLPKDYELNYVASLIRVLIAGGWASRLPQRLRVKDGLIYGWSSYTQTEHDTATLSLNLSTSKSSFNDLLKALSDEIIKFKSKGITNSELKRAKNFKLKPYSWSMERAGEFAGWYVDQELFRPNQIETPEEFMEKIKNVSKKDINEFAQKYITDDNWYMSVVGDITQKSTTKLQSLLQFG